jgi:hypothetical protein
MTYPEQLANTSVTIMSAEPPHLVSLVGCSLHLEGGAREDGKGVVGV